MDISSRSILTLAALGTCAIAGGIWLKDFNFSATQEEPQIEDAVEVSNTNTSESNSASASATAIASSFAASTSTSSSNNNAFQTSSKASVRAQNTEESKKIQTVTRLIRSRKINKRMTDINKEPEPELPPLPDSPFLSGDSTDSTAAMYNISPPRNIASETEAPKDIIETNLNWFLIHLGAINSQQSQKDSQFDQTTSITNPLVILLGIGKNISKTLGFEFSWKQKLSPTTPQKSNLPLNNILAGLTWSPFNTNSFKLLAGFQFNDASFLYGDPNAPTLKVYSEQNIYAGFQKNFEISDFWYLDTKFLFLNSPMKPSDFESYNSSGYIVSITPEYKTSDEVRVGLSLEYTGSHRDAIKLDSLGNKESLTLNQQNIGVGLSIKFTF